MAEQVRLGLALLVEWGSAGGPFGLLEKTTPCMLDGFNLLKAHDCYMQLEVRINNDCCFHVCICRIIL